MRPHPLMLIVLLTASTLAFAQVQQLPHSSQTPAGKAAPGGAPTLHIDPVDVSVTAFIGTAPSGPVDKAIHVTSFVDYQNAFGGLSPASEMSYAVYQFFQNGGTQAWVVRAGRRGLKALDAADSFGLLCLPGVSNKAALKSALDYCARRRVFLIVDAPAGKSFGDMCSLVDNGGIPQSIDAAVYYPWLKIADPLNPGQPRLVPPSGTVAGIYANVDQTSGCWKAAAGTGAAPVGAQGLAFPLTAQQVDDLASRGVNAFRNLAGRGLACWGARTFGGNAASAEEWKYIPVKRLGLMIEESVDRGTRCIASQADTDALRQNVTQAVEDFMLRLWRAGALQGQKPADAFFVKCDRTTNTQSDIAAGIVNILIGFAATKPAEFVIISVQQLVHPGS